MSGLRTAATFTAEVILKWGKKNYLESEGFSETLVTFTEPRGAIVSKTEDLNLL